MEKEQLLQLLRQRVDQTISETDQKLLSEFLEREDNKEMVVDVFAEMIISQVPDSEYNARRFDPMITDAVTVDKPTMEITGLKPIPIHFFGRNWWAAAAALILVTTGIFVFSIRNGERQTIAAVNPRADVSPGGNKAILTLANGSEIILDSAHNGLLAQQNGTNVIKSDSGKLTYNSTNKRNATVVYNTLTTPRGGQFQLTLPDGTKVWLNAASSITYPTAFNGKKREVTVTGEAYFEVVHNQKMPFHVKVNKQIIEDIGTTFNVNAYSDENAIQTTLIEGSVKVNEGDQNKVLSPGQQSNAQNGEIKVLNHADLEKVIAWKNGLFNFNGADLPTVLRQLGRWYDIEIRYEGGVSSHVFEGELDRGLKLSEVIEILGKVNIQFRIEGRALIVTQ